MLKLNEGGIGTSPGGAESMNAERDSVFEGIMGNSCVLYLRRKRN